MYYSAVCPSPLGMLTLGSDGEHLIGLWLEGQKYFGGAVREALEERDGLPVFDAARDWLARYLAGEKPTPSDLPLRPIGGELRQRVWRLLCQIPYGESTTYGALARALAAQRRIAAFARQVMVECIGAHDLGPLRPFGVGDFDGHRRAEGQAVAYTGQQTDLVLLELHAGTATISKSTACQCGNDIVRANTHAGRQPFNHGHQCFSVRLPCRLPTQHNFPRFMCVRLCVRLARG